MSITIFHLCTSGFSFLNHKMAIVGLALFKLHRGFILVVETNCRRFPFLY